MVPSNKMSTRGAGQASSLECNSQRAVCVARGARGRCPTAFDAHTVETTITDAASATTDPTTTARAQERRNLPTGPRIPIDTATTIAGATTAGTTTAEVAATTTTASIPATAHVTDTTGATTTDAASVHATSGITSGTPSAARTARREQHPMARRALRGAPDGVTAPTADTTSATAARLA